MKILIRLPNWLGDVVMSSAFVASVKELYPASTIDAIIKKELSSIAPLIPGLRTIYSFSKHEFKGLKGAYSFGRKLRNENYDLFFSLPSSLSAKVMAWATGAKKRIGFSEQGNFFLLTNVYKKPSDVHRVDEYISLLKQFNGKQISPKQVKLTVSQPVQPDYKRALINFNSEAVSRRMPIDKAVAILNLLTNTFKDITFTLIGSPKEKAFIDEVIAKAKDGALLVNYAGKTDIAGLAVLMAASAAIITTDSGPAHLANSVGTPTIVLFGAGNEHNTAPYNPQNLTILRAGKLNCEPCAKNTCQLYGIPKCMQLIDELHTIQALQQYLSNYR